jgi:putative transposase
MGKKVKGRKRHLLVDTEGLLLECVVHSAGIQDRDGARLVVEKAAPKLPRVRVIRADNGYWYEKLDNWLWEKWGWEMEVVLRGRGITGFQVLPGRWVVERTFAWLGKYRRLSKDYEFSPRSSEAMVYLASSHLMLRRLVPSLLSPPS